MLLNIREGGALDFLSLGALIHRLDPGVVPFRKAARCDIHVSGGEYNCAANLADCFGLRSAIATAMVRYPVGDMIAERVRAMGVTPFYKYFDHDGTSGPNMAAVYSDRGFGVRAPVVFYNRANEAAARLGAGDFDWDAIFGAGVRWFHSGGIFAALSDTTPDLIVEGMQAARRHGAVVSFDLNFRDKLWAARGGAARGRDVLRRIGEHVDVLIAGQRDLELRLGIDGPVGRSPFDTEGFFGMMDRVVAEFPHVKAVATPLRDVHSSNSHTWSAAAWVNGDTYVAPQITLDVFDRVGSGDGFAAGFFYGLLSGEPLPEAVRLGWAHGALLMTYPGDTTMATLEQVRAVASGASARIQR